MNILVLGSEGSLGRPLVRELRARGHDVYRADLRHAGDHHNYCRCDIAEYRQLRNVLHEWKPDLVYNLAAEFGRLNGTNWYEQLWRTNVIGLEHLLELQYAIGFRLVHFSSSEVYGEGPLAGLPDLPDPFLITTGVLADEPLSEASMAYNRIQPNSYAISKWVNECQCVNAMRFQFAKIVRVRLFCVYGPGEHYHPYRSVVCKFIHELMAGQHITVFRDHERAFLYVDDCVRTLANIAERFNPGQVYNIASTERTNILELARLVARELGLTDSEADARINAVGTEHGNALTKRPTVDAAVRDLDHRITVGIQEGVRRTIAWARGGKHEEAVDGAPH